MEEERPDRYEMMAVIGGMSEFADWLEYRNDLITQPNFDPLMIEAEGYDVYDISSKNIMEAVLDRAANLRDANIEKVRTCIELMKITTERMEAICALKAAPDSSAELFMIDQNIQLETETFTSLRDQYTDLMTDRETQYAYGDVRGILNEQIVDFTARFENAAYGTIEDELAAMPARELVQHIADLTIDYASVMLNLRAYQLERLEKNANSHLLLLKMRDDGADITVFGIRRNQQSLIRESEQVVEATRETLASVRDMVEPAYQMKINSRFQAINLSPAL